jgi:hypothetical protein
MDVVKVPRDLWVSAGAPFHCLVQNHRRVNYARVIFAAASAVFHRERASLPDEETRPCSGRAKTFRYGLADGKLKNVQN